MKPGTHTIGTLLRGGATDRAALLAPGPALATAFLVLAYVGVAVAPLNPDYQRAEFEFYFDDLQPGAVVLTQGATLDESELRAFARERLAGFKVPRRVVLVAEIPKGPTGKLQRIGLAQALGLS